MNIIQVSPDYPPIIGGIAEHVKNISERMIKENEVTVATTDPSGKLPPDQVINQIHVKRFKSYAPKEAYYLSFGLRKYLNKNAVRFDVVHAHNYQAFPALFAASAKKHKFIFSPHYHGAGATPLRMLLHKPYKHLGNKIFRSADAIICMSNYERDLVERDFKDATPKISVVPNGFNFEDFQSIGKAKSSEPYILTVGRLEKYKGIHYLIQALPKLDKRTSLHVVGKGPYKNNLMKITRQLHLENRVYFYQELSRTDLIAEYAGAQVFALLSNREAYGISVGEALCAKTPCLVAKASALTEWVDNVNCFGIDLPIDLDSLANSIIEVSETRVTSRPPSILNWSVVTKELLSIYQGS